MPAVALAVLAALLAAPSAMAALYKCATDKGVVYQDVACTPGTEMRSLDEDPPSLSVVPGAPVLAARPATSSKPARSRSVAHKARSRATSGNAAERRFIHTGMSQAEVVLRIGRPDVDTKGRGKAGSRWAYFPAPGDPHTLTTITIAGGTVVDVQRKVAR